MGLTAALHVGAAIVVAIISAFPDFEIVGAMFFVVLGVVQLVYIIPAIVIVYRRGQPRVVKGLILGAALTFLLNAACWGLVWGTFLI